MKAVRGGICIVIAFAALMFGGVQLWAQAVIEISATVLFLIWTIQACRRKQIRLHWNWLYAPLLAFWTLILFQYVFAISVVPYLTKIELFKWMAYLLLCFLATEVFRSPPQRRNFAWFLISFCFLISLFALLQYFVSNRQMYWFIPLPEGSTPFGSFVNHNHFAGFVELAEPMGLVLFLTGIRSAGKTLLLSLLTVVPIAALMISNSRGGIVSFLVQIVFLAWILREQMIGKRRVVAVTGLATITVVMILWLGISYTVQRFAKLAFEDISKDRRMLIYKDTWRIFRDNSWNGTGAGTFAVVYPHYEAHYDAAAVDHAHNDYLELLAETGVIGGMIGLGFIAILFWKGLANLQAARNFPSNVPARALYAGSFAACIGLLVHGLVDFNLQIPSNGMLFLLLAAITASEIGSRGELNSSHSWKSGAQIS